MRPRLLLAFGLLLVAIAVTFLVHPHRAKPTATVAAAAPVARQRAKPAYRPRGPHDAAIPILMFHVIAPPIANAPYPKLYVPAAEFAADVHALARRGYHGVTLRQAYDYWRGRAPLPARPVVLSFDDGYHSDYANALPVLRALGWPGVLNLEVRNLEPSWGLHPRLVRALIAAGWELDAHTLTHPDLTTLDAARLRREVAGSRAALRRDFGVPVDFFCYPSGRYDPAVVAAVRAAGYLGATTTNPGLGRPSALFTLDRVRVDGGEGPAALLAALGAAS